jgi:integrase
MSPLRKALKDYLALRRSLGFKLVSAGAALHKFVDFLEQERASHVTSELALRWAGQSPDVHPAVGGQRLGFVRGFARYRSATDPRTEVPPLGLFPGRFPRCVPYLYRDDEVRLLVAAAKALPSSVGLRPWTYSTLLGLLSVTGLRVSEAIGLQRGDVDIPQCLLRIRHAKFGKERFVPLHRTTTRVLRRYAEQRDAIHPFPNSAAFFLSDQGRPIADCMVRWTFIRLSRQIGLRKPTASSGPRLHDFRHRFAVRTLLEWYRSGVDVERRLPVLSTFLGHGHVEDTYWYLSAVPELLALTADRLEKRWEAAQ